MRRATHNTMTTIASGRNESYVSLAGGRYCVARDDSSLQLRHQTSRSIECVLFDLHFPVDQTEYEVPSHGTEADDKIAPWGKHGTNSSFLCRVHKFCIFRRSTFPGSERVGLNARVQSQ
jgi:hypothetical protein